MERIGCKLLIVGGTLLLAFSVSLFVQAGEPRGVRVHENYSESAWLLSESFGVGITLEDVRATADWEADDERWADLAKKIGPNFTFAKSYDHGADYLNPNGLRVMLESHHYFVKVTVGWRTNPERRAVAKELVKPKDVWVTPRGLKRGDSYSRILKLYGEPSRLPAPETLTRNDRLSSVAYTYIAENGDKYQLTFFVRGGKVDYYDYLLEKAGHVW